VTNSVGRLATETTSGTSHTYSYDNAGQLTGDTPSTGSASSWAYDELGRRSSETIGTTTKTYRYDDANQLCWIYTGTSSNTCSSAPSGATTYTYDNAGRRTNEHTSSTDDVSYTYDRAGRINTLARTTPVGTTTQTRTYDPDGNLVTADNAGNNTTSSTFDWDLTLTAPELIAQVIGSTTTDFAYGSDQWASQESGGVVAAIGLDVHSSVVPTSNTAGLAQSVSYTAWGEPSTSSVEPHLGYRGELGLDTLLDLRARQYDPDTSAFTSIDPLDGVDGTTSVGQRYAYAENDPLLRSDPTGEMSTDPVTFKTAGEVRTRTLIRHIKRHPGWGWAWANLFIHECRPTIQGNSFRGDCRPFDVNSPASKARSRIFFNFEQGDISFFVNYSCTADGDCHSALPTTAERGCSLKLSGQYGCTKGNNQNTFSYSEYDDGQYAGIEISFQLKDSAIADTIRSLSPAINADVNVSFRSGYRLQVCYNGDDYPSFEMYHVHHGRPHTVAQFPEGSALRLISVYPDRHKCGVEA
jgi:RHS repeat-associated protein